MQPAHWLDGYYCQQQQQHSGGVEGRGETIGQFMACRHNQR